MRSGVLNAVLCGRRIAAAAVAATALRQSHTQHEKRGLATLNKLQKCEHKHSSHGS
jgi:hypothetical protein